MHLKKPFKLHDMRSTSIVLVLEGDGGEGDAHAEAPARHQVLGPGKHPVLLDHKGHQAARKVEFAVRFMA